MEKKTLWETYTPAQLAEMEAVAEKYKACLNAGKTERECVRLAVKMAEEAGYKPLSEFIKEEKPLKAGDKIYAVYNEKLMALWHVGTEPLEAGMNVLGAHVDSPRLDVKQNPLYENTGFAYLDTHYYGGIKKYQWLTIPLALHGVVAKKDGSKEIVCVGEDEDDPVFAVTDLLIHLAQTQMAKTAATVVEGEALDLLIGSKPQAKADGEDKAAGEGEKGAKEEAGKSPVKEAVLKILADKYGMEEDDFLSAELEIVPAGKARDLGLDRSMIISYGQDDRICAFTSLMAMLDMEDVPKRTSCCLLVDKEEIGSCGASGMQSRFFENMTAEVLRLCGLRENVSVRRCLQNSKMLSSDVNAGFDPMFADVFEAKNSSYLGRGVVFSKYTGSRGKSGSNDANAEYLAALRRVMGENGVTFQLSELGKVDVGGGGTIAYIAANYGMEVIDCGLAILCMHAPMEISSKADVYEAVRCYKAFLKDMA